MRRQIRSKEHHLWAARDGRHAVLAAILLTFVVAASLSDGHLIPDFVNRGDPDVAEPIQPADDDLRTGAILIAPRDGNICELRLIDNETWQIRPGGKVECNDAVTWHPLRSDTYTAQSRIEVIRDGFFAKR